MLIFGVIAPGRSTGREWQSHKLSADARITATIVDDTSGSGFAVTAIISYRPQPIDPWELPSGHKGLPPEQLVRVGQVEGAGSLAVSEGNVVGVVVIFSAPASPTTFEYTATLVVQEDTFETRTLLSAAVAGVTTSVVSSPTVFLGERGDLEVCVTSLSPSGPDTNVDYHMDPAPPGIKEAGTWSVPVPAGSTQDVTLKVEAATTAALGHRSLSISESAFSGPNHDPAHQQYDFLDPAPSVTVNPNVPAWRRRLSPAIHGLVTGQFVLAQASDVPVGDVPTYIEMVQVADQVANYWNAASKGAVQLAVTAYPRRIKLPKTAAELATMSRWDIGTAIIQAARPEADLGSSDIFVGLVNTPCGGGAQGNRVVAGRYQELGQRNWRWCAKCQSLGFWDQSRSPGPCAAGGIHDHSSSAYYVARQQTPGETGWRWCHKCECLARPSGPSASCPSGGSHDFTGSGDYLVATASTPATQSGWTQCKKCTVLVFSGNPGAPCPAGGVHALVGTYYVGFDQFPALGFLLHETGHALGLDHSFNDNPKALDPGDDDRPGAYGDRWDIMSYSITYSYPTAEFLTAGPMLAAPTLFKNGWG